MEIVGDGFIARHTREYFADRYPSCTLIAAGVSSVLVTDASEFEREATLVYDVLRRCKAAGRTVVFLSTASAGMYGVDDSPGAEDGPVFPLTPYGRHKLALESVCAGSGARWLVLRLAHIVGAGQQRHQLLPSLTRQLLSGAVTVHTGASRDLLDVHDMLRMLDHLLDGGIADQVVNLATGRPEAVSDIVDGLEERLGVSAERQRIDVPTKHAVVDTGRLRALIPELEQYGFGPEYLATLLDRHVGELKANALHDLGIQRAAGVGRPADM
ncbi:NAD-dependent epimerase/dehydratase family protein [Streptomonospora sediminis]